MPWTTVSAWFRVDISFHRARAEKPAARAFSNFHPFGCRLLLRCCIASSTCNHSLRKTALYIPYPAGLRTSSYDFFTLYTWVDTATSHSEVLSRTPPIALICYHQCCFCVARVILPWFRDLSSNSSFLFLSDFCRSISVSLSDLPCATTFRTVFEQVCFVYK